MKWLLFIWFSVMLPGLATSQNSVLSEGNWYKLSIEEAGIYKLDYDFIENQLDINIENLDPRTVKIYGNGGGMLPQRIDTPRPLDLIQNPIIASGQADGKMDQNDYFLFYAKSPHEFELANRRWKGRSNLYTDKNYYFLTFGGEEGIRIEEQNEIEGSYPAVTDHIERIFIDESSINIGKSGREWYGNLTGRNSFTEYFLETPGARDSIHVQLELVGVSYTGAEFEVSMNGTSMENIPVSSVPDESYQPLGDEVSKIYSFKHTDPELDIRYSIVTNGETRDLLSYTNRITLSYDRDLTLESDQLQFSLSANMDDPISTVEIFSENLPDYVLDVSNSTSFSAIPFDYENNSLRFNSDRSKERNYVVFRGNDFPRPEFEGTVPNQNLKSLSPADGLIVTHPDFLSQAERLAFFHSEQDGLDIAVVTSDHVYNELSSGKPDLTAIRDLTHFYWKKTPSFRYLLLFGDGSFDYKDRVSQNTNFVPIYQSRESLDPVLSYCSDDYFGFMDDDEGEWIENRNGDHTLEIGVGRIPVTTPEQAEDVVDKIIRYATSTRLIGEWKNTITYVVDDGDNNLHMNDAEDFSDYVFENHPSISINKLYLDIYDQEIFPNYETSSSSRRAVESTIDQGTFMVNYIGHGNEEQWMAENVLDREVVNSLSNRFKLPVFVTATCEFGRVDDPTIPNNDRASSAEVLLRNPNGGAIALLTTSRPVFASSNYLVNAAFHTFLFEKENRLGDIMRKTKNASLSGPRNRNFSLLGDPFLRLAYPEQNISIDEINESLFTSSDTLSALEHITLSGSIRNPGGSINPVFDGVATIKIFDRIVEKRTRGQENAPFTYKIQENILFRGKVSVKSGEFQSTFILPKNISYRFEEGKIEVYASSEDNSTDASGATRDILIGGSNPDPEIESNPPEVYVYLNDSSFQNGDKVGSSSLFIAQLKDESGINTSGIGISQDITLTLSNGENYVLNNYYTAHLDSYQEGSIVFPLNDLEAGKYTATLKVWDIHNNPVESSVSFIVSDRPQVRLFNVRNYPNPIEGKKTIITFDHDRMGEELGVKIWVYDLEGSMIGEYGFEVDASTSTIDGLEINMNSEKLNPGIYFYHLRVKSSLDNAVGEKTGKMIKIN